MAPKNPTIAITGASSGIGAALARDVDAWGGRRILIARSEDRLRVLADQLDCDVMVRVCDLSDLDAVRKLGDELAAERIDVLVNNAGLGWGGHFVDQSDESLFRILDVNVRALVVLTRRVLPGFVERRRGYVLNVGSVAGEQGSPFMAVYGATKSFVNDFSEAIASELIGTGANCGVLLPGSTTTEFFERAEIDTDKLAKRFQTAEEVARRAVTMIEKQQTFAISGFVNRVMVEGTRFSPRAVVRWVARRVLAGMADGPPGAARSS